MSLNEKILEKYSVSIPRYTSYPTAPECKEIFTEQDFLTANEKANKSKTPISLYFHLPFCESQCYFCACNIVISKKREVTESYLKHIKKEIIRTSNHIDKTRKVEQIHLGGGTPTYFTPEELTDFFSTVTKYFNISDDCETSIEIDPRVTTFEHIHTLKKIGFNRLSLGIQDFNETVQESVNRIQPFELTKNIMDEAYKAGFISINTDLMYGLPYQSLETFKKTLELVLKLNPDRIALFHYAHLPQLLKHQDKYISSSTLPDSSEKIKIFQYAVNALTANGYVFIGLDHFAKPDDELSIARRNKTLYRNFQGYTTRAGCDLYGFGITAISNIQNTFSQNIKKLNPYYEAVDFDKIPIYRGVVLSKDDLLRKEIITKILCHGEIVIPAVEEKYDIDFNKYFAVEIEHLKELEKDGLILYTQYSTLKVTPLGQFFLRNIASGFDYYLNKKDGKQKVYSKSI